MDSALIMFVLVLHQQIGAAVGNGVGGHNSSNGDGARGRALFYYGKGLFPTSLKETIEAECGPLTFPSAPGWAMQSAACRAALQNMSETVGPHNFYNLDDFCSIPEFGATIQEWLDSIAPRDDGSLPRMDELVHRKSICHHSRSGKVNEDSACATYADYHDGPLGEAQLWCGVDTSMMTWLGCPDVVEALHVTKPKGTEKNNLRYTGKLHPTTAVALPSRTAVGYSSDRVVGGYRDGDLRSLYKELALQYRVRWQQCYMPCSSKTS